MPKKELTPEQAEAKKQADLEKAEAKKKADLEKAEAKKKADLEKAKASPTYGFSKISDYKGKFVKSSAVSSVSENWLMLHDGKTATYGYIQRYDVDVNATHINAKKGDLVFIDKAGNPIKNVTHFLP